MISHPQWNSGVRIPAVAQYHDLLVSPGNASDGRLTLSVPGDKSVSHRALLFAAATPGETEIVDLNKGEAVLKLLTSFEQLGISVRTSSQDVIIEGLGNDACERLRRRSSLPHLNLGGSSAAARLLIGWLVGMNIPAVVDGNAVLRTRPMDWLIDPLRMLGAEIDELGAPGRLPVAVRCGNLRNGEVTLRVGSAQARSAVVLAAALANVRAVIHHPVLSRDHTERLLRHAGIRIESSGRRVVVSGGSLTSLARIEVPGDPSLAAYPAALHVLRRSSSCLVVRNVCVSPTRSGFFRLLCRIGADCSFENQHERYGEAVADVVVGAAPDRLAPFCIDDPFEFHALIDEVPLACALAATIQGTSEIRGAEELSFKETDRFETTRALVSAMGGVVEIRSGCLVIHGGRSRLHPAVVHSARDHRIAMAATVLAASIPGQSRIIEGTSYETSFPNFVEVIRAAGGRATVAEFAGEEDPV